MQLKGKQNQLFLKALICAFTVEDLQRLVKHELDKNLDEIATGKNLTDLAFKLINYLERRRLIEKFMKGALEENPDNLRLQFAVAAIIFYHILKPLEKKYEKEIQASYSQYYPEHCTTHNDNESEEKSIVETIFNCGEFATIKESNFFDDTKLNNLFESTVNFYISNKSKNGDLISKALSDLNYWCTRINKKKFKIFLEKNKIHQYYTALLILNFDKQISLFKELVGENSGGACIIHGKEGSGQSWLLHRLKGEIPNPSDIDDIKPKIIKIDIKKFSRDIESIFNCIKRYLPPKYRSSEKELINGIYNLLGSQNVVIEFDDVNSVSKECIEEFIDKLWLKLVKKIRNYPIQSNKFKLFMFLIDDTGCVEKWTIQLKDSCDDDWTPDFPIKLPSIEKLSYQDLNNWIKNCKRHFPNNLTILEESDIQNLLEKSDNGLFMKFLVQICDKCDEKLWDYIDKCLKY